MPYLTKCALADNETRPQWTDNLFHESDESGDEFEGFHPDWVTGPRRFRPVNAQDCLPDGGSAYQHPGVDSYYFGLMWNDEVN